MRRKIAFYIGWDILLAAFLYVRYLLFAWMRYYTGKTYDMIPAVWTPAIFTLFAGILIAILVIVGNKVEQTKESAVIELVVVGLFALYLTAIPSIPYIIISIPIYMPMWLCYNSEPMEMGFILLGYELSMVTVRISRLKKNKNADKAEVCE